MRPWKENEIPIGKLVRFRKGDQHWRGRITKTEQVVIMSVDNSPMTFEPKEALWLLEYCEDDKRRPTEQVWRACGIVEGSEGSHD